jgi:asparagine synthase (glutamine-hydrolysing)
MCGITGFLDTTRAMGSQALHGIAREMAASMIHRGPDDEGTYADETIGLAFGFRRLSIIDLTPAGHQPMISTSGRSAVAFNGEIYNAETLRPTLLGRGITFRGHSDTEILLEFAECFGLEATLAKLVGMFAIAFHDRATRAIWLARDRMGEKPLYIGRFGRTVMFASELRCFRKHPEFRPEIDPASLSAYMRFGYVPNPRAIFKNVEMLPPGGLARITADGEITISRYWRADDAASAAKADPFKGSDADAVEALDRVLRDAVRGCMAADVPLGAFLSGGVDSSTVVALMQAQSSRPVRTFSIGFHVDGFDEAPYARAIAQHLGTGHEERYFTAQDMIDLVPSIPDIYDEPFADSSQLPTYIVSKMARRHVTVSLSGDGGDESFAGYTRYGQIATLNKIAGVSPALSAPLGRVVNRLMNTHVLTSARALMPPVFCARVDRWSARLNEVQHPHPFESVYRRLLSQGLPPEELLVASAEQAAEFWSGTFAERFPGAVERAQIIDTMTYLPDDILTKVDRASMAVSLEARAPLLDHRVVGFAWRLPHHLKMRGADTKWALKQVLHRYVPRKLVERPKMGFGVPIDVWLRGPLRDWAESLIDERRLAAEGTFAVNTVRLLWKRHLSGEQWQYPLWVILMFQAWRERWGH